MRNFPIRFAVNKRVRFGQTKLTEMNRTKYFGEKKLIKTGKYHQKYADNLLTCWKWEFVHGIQHENCIR